jgi:hypothetical protein
MSTSIERSVLRICPSTTTGRPIAERFGWTAEVDGQTYSIHPFEAARQQWTFITLIYRTIENMNFGMRRRDVLSGALGFIVFGPSDIGYEIACDVLNIDSERDVFTEFSERCKQGWAEFVERHSDTSESSS